MAEALRQLSFGTDADELVEMLKLSGSIFRKWRQMCFCAVCFRFRESVLRRSTANDAKTFIEKHSKLGFPAALRLLDCSEWELYRGSVSKQRRTIEKSESPEYHLESWCDDRLWTWHLECGFPGVMNDLNILSCSPLISEVQAGMWPLFEISYSIAGRTIDWFIGWFVGLVLPSRYSWKQCSLSIQRECEHLSKHRNRSNRVRNTCMQYILVVVLYYQFCLVFGIEKTWIMF